MSILRTTLGPRNDTYVLAHALTHAHTPAAGHSGLRSLDPESTRFGQHHAVYDLSAKTLAEGGGFDEARRTGSRYLLADANGLSGAMEIASDPQGVIAGPFKSLNRGPLVQGTEAAIKLAEAQSGAGPSEFSVLRIAALRLWLLWVKPDDASRPAQFYVIHPAPVALPCDRPFAEDALLSVLRPLAINLLKPEPDAGAGDDVADVAD